MADLKPKPWGKCTENSPNGSTFVFFLSPRWGLKFPKGLFFFFNLAERFHLCAPECNCLQTLNPPPLARLVYDRSALLFWSSSRQPSGAEPTPAFTSWMYFYMILLRGFRKEAIDCLKGLYNRWLFTTTTSSSYDDIKSFFISSVQYPIVTVYRQCRHSYTKPSVWFTSIMFPLISPSEETCDHFFLLTCLTLFIVGILVTSPWMCVYVCVRACVNLWKLYYANCYLKFFFFSRENYLNKWEYFFIFLQKMCGWFD